MAGNFEKPVTTDLYTDILTLIRENQTELAKMLDGSTATNIPTGAKRWNETNKRFEKFDGSTWTALVPDATTSASGLMSAADKTKVDTLKTGSSTDKQTSVTDATDGRLLINAAFGLAGASAPTSLSAAGALDSIAHTSVYGVSAANVATVGAPSGANGGVVFTIRYSSTFAVQSYLNVLGGVRSWSRQCNNGAWSAWVENLHTGNIAPTHIPEDATHRWATDAEKMNWNSAKTHADSAHAPSTAQKNSDITKAEIEAKLTGTISTHTHPEANADTVDGYHAQLTPAASRIPVADGNGKIADGWINLPARLGVTCTTITDWNAAKDNGWYMAAGANGAPDGNWYIGMTIKHNDIWAVQMVCRFACDGVWFVRNLMNGAWGTWSHLVTTPDHVQWYAVAKDVGGLNVGAFALVYWAANNQDLVAGGTYASTNLKLLKLVCSNSGGSLTYANGGNAPGTWRVIVGNTYSTGYYPAAFAQRIA